MSYLLIDVGNSFTKFSVFTDETLSVIKKFKTNMFEKSINTIDVNNEKQILKIILVSVVDDEITMKIEDKLLSSFQCPIQQVYTEESKFGVKCGYNDCSILGADRWIAIIAAYNKVKSKTLKPVMVVDCGTVITVDVIDSNGQHLGGWMMPSAILMHESLLEKSKGIKKGISNTTKKVSEGVTRLGHSTYECVEIGAQLAEVGFIEQCFIQTQNSLKEVPLCILTGGGANDIFPMLTMKVEHLPNLVFDGLALFAE